MTEKADIHLLVRMNDLESVRFHLYVHRESIDKPRPRTGETPLHIAVDCGLTEMVDLILRSKPNLFAMTLSSGWTPLHVAANRGNDVIIEKLLAAAEDIGAGSILVEAIDREGMTAVHVTCVAGHLSTLILLVETYAANLSGRTRIGDTPLHLACHWGQMLLVSYFLDVRFTQRVNVREQNEHGNTPLHRACAKGHSEIANLLTLRGANLLAVNNEGLTPVDVSSPEMIKQIK